MTLLGIGNDIVEIGRMRAVFAKYPHRFLKRVFTPLEQKYCLEHQDPIPHLAGRFAAKEAVVKALGVGFSQGLTWLDIEIQRQTDGRPTVYLSPCTAELFHHPLVLISISHCREYATAVATWVAPSGT